MEPFEYRLELLKWELDSIESSIRKIDDLGNSTKNWAIITWIGAITVLMREPPLHKVIYITALPPLLFMLVDAHWRSIQRMFMFRMNKISDFMNSTDFDKACSEKDLSNFYVLDPISRKDKGREELHNYIALKRILRYPTVSMLYIGQALLSIIIWAMINA
ncbi:MAG: hypothetical protein D3909_19385 [Candidatus Electrothrix sp. ATG1]|nr:hypothetical protein [Candidatus Electrothrix sp. ATG1]